MQQPGMAELYDGHTPLVAITHQPALLAALLAERDADASQLWTGLERSSGADVLSPRQLLRLLANAEQALGSPDAAFVLGASWWPGHYGAASHALRNARCLREALELLVRHAARLSPLLVPHWVETPDEVVLYWTEACQLGAHRRLAVEVQMAATVALCRWRAGSALPWHCCFNRTASPHPEQLQVHLGSALQFGCQLDALLIDACWLDAPWLPPPDGTAGGRAAVAAAMAEQPPQPLLGALYALLLDRVRVPVALEDCAAHFAISAATFKRRLAAEGTHFQAELDQVRSHVALHLFRHRGCDNDAVARHLGFHDAANFRRSFKRWTGLTPSLLRQAWSS